MTEAWYVIGSFFGSADAGQTSQSAYEYTNGARLNGIRLVQTDMSGDGSNPHPQSHLQSEVVDGTPIYRKGGPPFMNVYVDDSDLPSSFSELSFFSRSAKVQFSLWIPSTSLLCCTSEGTASTLNNPDSPFWWGWFRLICRSSSVTCYFDRNGGTDYGCPNLSYNRWYDFVFEYDKDTNLTTYSITGVYSVSFAGNYLNGFFSDGSQLTNPSILRLAASYSTARAWYLNENGLQLANLIFSITDEVPIQPPTVSIDETMVTVGRIDLTVTAVPDPNLDDPTLTYSWSTGATATTISITANGTYTVTVTDSQGNVTQKSYTVTNYVGLPYPLQSSYSQEHAPSVVRTQMLDKHARQRTLAGKPPSSLSCKFQMDESQFTAWVQAWKETLNEGADWFYLQALGKSNAVIENKQVRLRNGEWSYSLVHHTDTGNLYEVSMKFDVKEA